LSAGAGRIQINDFTNPKLFLSSGKEMSVDIYDITEAGDSIGFKVAFISSTSIVKPLNASSAVSINPQIVWRKQPVATSYTLQLSTSSSFETLTYQRSAITDTMYTISDFNLNHYTTYYARVLWKNATQTSQWSSVVSFTTVMSDPVLRSACRRLRHSFDSC
jgi:hypothetical protein